MDMFGPPDLSSPSYHWGPYSRGRGTNLPVLDVQNVFEKARLTCSHVKQPLDASYDFIDSRIFILGRSLCVGPWTTDNLRLVGRSSLNPCEASSLEGHIKKIVKRNFVPAPNRRAWSEEPSKRVSSSEDPIRKAVKALHRYAIHPATVSDPVRYASISYQVPGLH